MSNIFGLDPDQKIQISKEERITSLWAGYGTINSVQITISPKGETRSIVVKRVKPPRNDSSLSNRRKLKSYHIEAFFYKELVPMLLNIIQLDNSLPLQVATPYSIEKSPGSFTFILSDLSDEYMDSYSSSLSASDQTRQAIRWLAGFHAAFFKHPCLDSQSASEGDENNEKVWAQGGYWHLKTRPDELESISSNQSYFQKSANAIDERMNEHELSGYASHTLVHGDYKEANILFGSDPDTNCAAVDFQYTGKGYGAKDLVMWIVSSVPSRTFDQLGGENGILAMYHNALCECVGKIRRLQDASNNTLNLNWTDEDVESFTNFDNIKMQYELALVDYVRFMAGWGMWGSNCGYAESRAREILKEIAGGSAQNMRNFSSADWKRAIYEKYPVEMF